MIAHAETTSTVWQFCNKEALIFAPDMLSPEHKSACIHTVLLCSIWDRVIIESWTAKQSVARESMHHPNASAAPVQTCRMGPSAHRSVTDGHAGCASRVGCTACAGRACRR